MTEQPIVLPKLRPKWATQKKIKSRKIKISSLKDGYYQKNQKIINVGKDVGKLKAVLECKMA